MPYLLNLIYLTGLLLASPWLVWRSFRTGRYREGFAEKLLGRVPRRSGDRTCIWFHAVSVGEVNLLQTMLEKIAREAPDWQCVISTTTKTGMELARKKYSQHTVFYCPLDFSWAVKSAIRRIRPDMLILAELEVWPNLIHYVRRSGAPVVVVNGRLSEKSFRGYRKLGLLIRGIMRKLSAVAAQDETTAQRFIDLGVPRDNVTVTGSLKFDGARTDRDNPDTERLARLAEISNDETVFLAGSTQSPEEEAAIETYRNLREDFPQLRLILVPRHPERFDEVAELLDRSGLPWIRRTEMSETATGGKPIILVDAVGELGAWWGLAEIAFVGGSWGSRGGQNMIEPSGYGAAVSFGPLTRNFRDIVAMLLSSEAAVVVSDQAEMEQFVRSCLHSPEYASELGEKARKIVLSQQGAAEKTYSIVRRAIKI